ncbi:MAG: M15 family metallopeptidase [Candidatus Zixiibacteriota bacterium]|nr:MAG: M15 family metallopeptidase [candidate division Zixibacteria bacterium]
MIKSCLIGIALLAAFAWPVKAERCEETVLIDSVEYRVGERWCGKRIDSTRLAVRERLSRIPDEYCFENYRIYIDLAARDAFVRMAESARSDSVFLIVDSGYRSAGYQAKIIARRMAEGDRFNDIIRYVAPPGYSLHETGMTIDLIPSDHGFTRTAAYAWLTEHAADFGFAETSPKDSAGVMPWEPWHWTYLLETE